MAGVEFVHGLRIIDIYLLRMTWLELEPNLSAADQHWVPNMALFPANYLMMTGYFGPLPTWKGQHYVLPGIDTNFWHNIAFPKCSTSVKATICGFTEWFIHSCSFPTMHCFWSINKVCCTANEIQQCVCAHGIHWSYREEYDWGTGNPLGNLLAPWLKLIENYNNLVQAGFLMAQTLQEWRFQSPY